MESEQQLKPNSIQLQPKNFTDIDIVDEEDELKRKQSEELNITEYEMKIK